MITDEVLNGRTLIILTPAFPPDESQEQSPWLPAKQSLIRAINRCYPQLEVVILSFQYPESKVPYTWNGNKVIPFGGANKRNGHNLLLWYRVFRKLMLLKKQKSIAGIISFWCAECCMIGSLFGKRYGYRHLCWISGQDAKAGNKFVNRIRPRPDELVAMSDFLKKEFEANYGIRPQYLIPDAIDTTLFPNEEPVRDIDIIGAGNLIPFKQYDIFIDVAAGLKRQLGDVTAVICGYGVEEPNLTAQIARLGLDDNVLLTGLLPHKEVLKLMKRARILLHTSNYEGFGNVCIEALYAGAHVISFTRPMQRDIEQWHIVKTREEMFTKAFQLLSDKNTAFISQLPFNMDDSARMFVEAIAT